MTEAAHIGTQYSRRRLRWLRDALDADIKIIGTAPDGGFIVLVTMRDVDTANVCPVYAQHIPALPP